MGSECEPEKWNSHSGCAAGTKENIKGLHAFLDNLQSDAYEAHWYLHKNRKLITAESLKNRMQGKSDNSYKRTELFKDHNSKVATLVSKGFAH